MADKVTGVQRLYKYCEDVEKGKVLTNKWVKLAVKRFRTDLKKSKKKDYPYYFDEESANKFIDFTELLKQYQDPFAGQPLILEPWECFIMGNIYGWLYKDTKERRFRKAFLFVARKNGKTTLLASSLLYSVFLNGSSNYCCATKRDQAMLLFDSVKEMVKQNSILQNHLKTFNSTHRIINERKASKIEALSADSDTLDGLNAQTVVCDEVSAMKDYSIISVLQSGQGSRRSPLLFEITSGSDNLSSAGFQEFERSSKILDGIFEDDSYFCILYCLDEKDDWTDSKLWQKANPNLGVSVKLDFLEKTCKEAIQNPALRQEFKTKNLGLWDNSSTAWIDAQTWDKCVKNADKYKFDPHKQYYANVAIDLSKRTDLTAMTLTLYQDEKFFLKHFLYFPSDSMKKKITHDNELWEHWTEEGWLTATPGEVIDYSYLYRDIKKLAEEYDIQEVLFDPFNSGGIINELQEDFNMVEVQQNIKNLSPFAKSLEAEIRKGNIVCDNPVMKWAISNATVYIDANNNLKIEKVDKQRNNRRIDCVITTSMGVGRICQLLENKEIDTRSTEEIRADIEKFLSSIDY